MNQKKREWNQLTAAKHLKVSLNPIRNWVETVVPVNEKISRETEGLNRPETQLLFTIGDPTRYSAFQTPQ